MADPREIFPILDDGTDSGSAPAQKQEGDAPGSGNGLIGFSFKDSSGDVVLPQLSASGAIPTTSDAGATLRANGELAAGNTSLADVTNAEITLDVSKKYSGMSALVSCRRDTLFQFVYVDDADGTPAETVLLECIVGSGQYSFKMDLTKDYFDPTGGTGTQKFKIKGQNFQKASSMRASISAQQSA